MTEELEDQVEALEVEKKTLEDALLATKSYVEKANFMDDYVVFVEDDGTGLYHSYDCEHFTKSKFWAYSRRLAEANGYHPAPSAAVSDEKKITCLLAGDFRLSKKSSESWAFSHISDIIGSEVRKMLERGKMERGVFEIVDTESLVPPKHLLRKIDAAVDFTRIYDMVEPLYCLDNGRPSIDPVVLFKMVLIQHLYGLPSLRRTAEEVSANMCYRWFLGYRLQEETPHFSTISYNFRHRFTTETVDQIFAWILSEIAEAGYLSPSVVFVDGTHIKANANTKKQIKAEIPVAAKHYAKELMEEVNQDREAHEKKPFFRRG